MPLISVSLSKDAEHIKLGYVERYDLSFKQIVECLFKWSNTKPLTTFDEYMKKSKNL